jgi:hypothetical protein
VGVDTQLADLDHRPWRALAFFEPNLKELVRRAHRSPQRSARANFEE